jgi:hypothetical protein
MDCLATTNIRFKHLEELDVDLVERKTGFRSDWPSST